MQWNDFLEYNNGVLTWKVKVASKVIVGKRAGCINKVTGYRLVRLNHKNTMEHRIVWEMHNGPIPEDMEIDHINHVRDDNRIENLRMVTRQSNNKNASKRSDNTSGTTGVSWNKKKGRWVSSIDFNGKRVCLGYFSEISDAINSRLKAEADFGFHRNHGIEKP